MKPATRAIILLSIMFTPAGFAQEQNEPEVTNAATSALSGGLQIDSRTDQERIDFLLQVASVYFDEEDYTSAIGVYERILEIDPLNKNARFIIAHVYISAKQYAKAETSLKKLIAEYPDDFQLKNNLAWLYSTAEDPSFRDGEAAIKLAQEAMAIAPNDHHVWSTLSEAYYVTGQYEKALRAIEQMARIATRYGQGITEEMVDEYTEQIQKCQRAWESEKALKGEDESAGKSLDEETDQPVLDTSDQ